MGFTAVKCPSCGANIELDDSREFGFCNYCGAKIVQDKIIVEHRGTVKIEGTATADTLLERAKIMLHDGDFANANTYFDRVLDIEPHCSEAYWGKLCCKLHAPDNVALQKYQYSILEEPVYKKAIEYADAALKEEYQGIGKQTVVNQDVLIREQQGKVYRDSRITVRTSTVLALDCATFISAIITASDPIGLGAQIIRIIGSETIFFFVALGLFYLKTKQEFRAVQSFKKGEHIQITPKLWKSDDDLKKEKTGLVIGWICFFLLLGFLLSVLIATRVDAL